MAIWWSWFNDHWLREAFCITLVRGLDQAEVLRRLGGEQSQPRTLTAAEAGELSGSFDAGYPQLVLAARAGGWSVAVEDNGWEGSRPEVLRALSGGTQAVSVYRNVEALGYFNYAVAGEVLVGFELLFPQRRWGSQPDLLLPQMRAVGLDPDRQQPPHGEFDTAALALAERVTGVHLDPSMLEGPLHGGEIAPLGWRIRTWAVEVRVAERVRNDPRTSLDAQQREASLLRAAGRTAERPLKDPSLWLGRGWTALVLRWRSGQAVRAALFADPRGAIYATLEQLRYLPGDPWMGIRAAALEVLRSGSGAGPPAVTDR